MFQTKTLAETFLGNPLHPPNRLPYRECVRVYKCYQEGTYFELFTQPRLKKIIVRILCIHIQTHLPLVLFFSLNVFPAVEVLYNIFSSV